MFCFEGGTWHFGPVQSFACSILELRLKSWEKQPCTLAQNGGPQTERQFAFIFRTPSCACCFGGLEIVTKFSRPPFLSTKLASSSLKMASACSQNPPVAMCTAWDGTGSIQGTALGQYRARKGNLCALGRGGGRRVRKCRWGSGGGWGP